ncbi:GAF domain-containing protein [Neolewinella aurantiaca]|uniref:GAF domain-containing protein n=1 Tax=Neolewinella aurantiaca TaxID=2602767 RepID=A0A5C7F264_9BACT|nr:GAF domain-containing protein [Neolewinella aurantiaca]TXF84028.1 GAF domain-containing protein [Neolewinella aurantiaca]
MELDITIHNGADVLEAPIVFTDGRSAGGMNPFDIPYGTELCFGPVLKKIRTFIDSEDAGIRFLAREVVRLSKDSPELDHPIQELSVLDNHKDLLDMLMLFIIPPSDRETEFFKFSKPFNFAPIYMSGPMQSLMSMQDACYSFGGGLDIVRNRHIVFIGCFILQRLYGVDVDMTPSAMLTVNDSESGLNRFYKPEMNQKYIDVVPNGEIPDLSRKDIQRLLNNINDTDLWLKLLPADKFSFHGIHISHLFEVTEQESLSRIKQRLISRDAVLNIERVRELANLTRVHFSDKTLQLGLTAVDYPVSRTIDHEYRIKFNFLSEDVNRLTDEAYRSSVYDRAFRTRDVVLVDDLTALRKTTRLEKLLIKQGIRSLLVAPLLDQQKNVIGMVELGSPKVYGINAFMEIKFREIRGLFRTAVERSREYIDNRIEAIMREQYTSLHSSVEWRFTEAASNILERQDAGHPDAPEVIAFKDVYPLYGQADIVGSSRLRNAAIYQDLADNMRAGRYLLVRAMEHVEFPLIQQVIQRIDGHLKTGIDNFDNSHEIFWAEFIHQQLTPLIEELSGQHPEIADLAENYFSDLDIDLGLFYRVRSDYEESVTRLNRSLSDFFTERDQATQKTLPHYFEKYKTDGVEYEIYAGQSLLKNHHFSNVHLRNLRLAQLIDMCEATRLTTRLSQDLPMPLRTAQLIFAYTSPLDIKFRMDEKRFDVDGDYNVRYEILKKRIDKATIRKGQERLTLANMISIVYLNDKDREEYSDYLSYLKEAGYVDGEVEDLILDPLQSVNGLRALRFRVRE